MVDLDFVPETRSPTIKGDYCYIRLACGLVAYIDASDYHLLLPYRKWHASFSKRGKKYANTRVGKKFIKLHHVILPLQEGFVVDHENGNPLDNTKKNLRLVTQQHNTMNAAPAKNGSSRYKGVSRDKNKWRTRIRLDDKFFSIGHFKCEIEAALAYDRKAKEFHGEYAWLNQDNFVELQQ